MPPWVSTEAIAKRDEGGCSDGVWESWRVGDWREGERVSRRMNCYERQIEAERGRE